ncbi:hypothetical protein [Streptomyces sp. NBC_00199]|jgi:hypothetical protein|uniref:hypothetical protein n=1 Tax=Streptomyces sp. NBC_00199 TaxID=2975678 RepID=UPI00224F808C|nr:hypothetical protein [Streptomyces sp. NBC_00199]MCX5269502.1 hypothetical protein [Streptomyces sp. NBC_00199]
MPAVLHDRRLAGPDLPSVMAAVVSAPHLHVTHREQFDRRPGRVQQWRRRSAGDLLSLKDAL